MKSKFTISILMSLTFLIASCSKNEFNEHDALAAQKELLNLKYQHELDLEILKQKGATALQQLLNTAALEQLKLNDSLTNSSAINAKKEDYSVTVVDAFTNTPITDADVTVSSQGKVYAAKTNAQGVVTFTSLYLFPTSSFLISKTGYAATQVLQRNIYSGAVKLWNTADQSNEIAGNLFIDTDLTNITPEKVGANVLVTASTTIQGGSTGSYTVYFPAYTTATGSYSIKLPSSVTTYNLSFGQIVADQKLYVNATEDDANVSFPNSLPRLTTVKTYFNVNSYSATVPTVNSIFYFKIAPDKTGKTFYISGNTDYYGNGQIFLTAVGNQFQVSKLNITNYYQNGNYVDINAYTYEPNAIIDVEIVDISGNTIKTAPILAARTDQYGKLSYTGSQEGGSGYIHLKRDNAGNLVANARGEIVKATYNSYIGQYVIGNSNNNNSYNNQNIALNRAVNTSYYFNNKGDKKIIDFYYGSGDSRVKQVY